MSTLRATNLKGGSAGSAPNFPDGAVITGVATVGVLSATTFYGSGANLTGIDATALKDGSGNVKIQANSDGAVVTGVVTATTFSGNITGATGSFTGNVSVGGTLTYEDVTNIDSVGVITARSGIVATGVVTATSFAGSGANLTGIDAAPQVKVNATGAISAGDPVIANTDGTVSKIGLSYSAVDPITRIGCPSELNYPNNSTETSDWLTCQLEDNYMVVAYKNESGSNTIYAAWVKIDGGTPTWSSNGLALTASNGTLLDLHYDPTRNQAVVVYKLSDDRLYFRTLRRNPGAADISGGTQQQLNTTAAYNNVRLSYDTAANKFLVVYGKDPSQSNYCTAQVMTVVDNDTFTFGSLVTIKSNECAHIATDFDTAAGKHLVLYRDNSVSNDCYGIVATVSGTSVTFGTAVALETGPNEGAKIEYSTTDGKFLWLSYDGTDEDFDVSVLTISGTSVSRGTNTAISTIAGGINTGVMAISYDPNLNVFYICYRKDYVGKTRTATISGTNVTLGSETNSRCAANSVADCDIGYDKGSGRTLLVMQNGATNAGINQVWTTSTSTTNVTASNYLGLSAASYTNGQLATIKLSGNTDSNQVGLTTGKNYFARNDGTVSLTSQSPQVFVGNAISSTKLVLASPAAPAAGWEVVESYQLDGSVGYIDSNGWSNDYARYKIVYDNIYSSSNWKPYIRIYKDATSGNPGTLKTGSNYGSGSGYQRVQTTMNQLQRTGRNNSDFWKTGWNGAATYWSGENTFPMSTGTGGSSIKSMWYGFSFQGYEHTYTSASGFYNGDEDKYLTGIRFYFSTNDSGNTITPTSGRFTVLRLKV